MEPRLKNSTWDNPNIHPCVPVSIVVTSRVCYDERFVKPTMYGARDIEQHYTAKK